MFFLCIFLVTVAPTIATVSQPSFGLIPSQPRNVNANPISANEISISWQEPSITNGLLSYYKVFYSSPNVAESMFIAKPIYTHF